ncbi:MAG: ribbon-helix-helix protein, CopG family [Nanoarchaeota archaeon]
MPVISISLNDRLAKDISQLLDKQGFSGKSELFRAAVRDYLNNNYQKVLQAESTYSVTLSVVIPETKRSTLHLIHDKFLGIVRSQFHLCLKEDRCLEVFGISGKGRQLLDLLKEIEGLPKVEKINVCVAQ